jgi:hypothetical protein
MLLDRARETSMAFDCLERVHAIAEQLSRGELAGAREWVAEHRSRLTKNGSPLLFEIEVADFLGLVIEGRRDEAIALAAERLAPLATGERGALHRLQQLMGVLAFSNPRKCGVITIEEMFSADRFAKLVELFRQEAMAVHGLLQTAPLRIALYAGSAALKSPFDDIKSSFTTRREWIERTALPAVVTQDAKNPSEAAASLRGLRAAMHHDGSCQAILNASTTGDALSTYGAVDGPDHVVELLRTVRAHAPRLRHMSSKVMCALTGLPMLGADEAAPKRASEGAGVPLVSKDPSRASVASATVPLCSFPGSSLQSESKDDCLLLSSTSAGHPVALPCGRVVGDRALLLHAEQRCLRLYCTGTATTALSRDLARIDAVKDSPPLDALRSLGHIECPFTHEKVPTTDLRRAFFL